MEVSQQTALGIFYADRILFLNLKIRSRNYNQSHSQSLKNGPCQWSPLSNSIPQFRGAIDSRSPALKTPLTLPRGP